MFIKKPATSDSLINSTYYIDTFCGNALTSMEQCDRASQARNSTCEFMGEVFDLLAGGFPSDVSDWTTSNLEEDSYV